LHSRIPIALKTDRASLTDK